MAKKKQAARYRNLPESQRRRYRKIMKQPLLPGQVRARDSKGRLIYEKQLPSEEVAEALPPRAK